MQNISQKHARLKRFASGLALILIIIASTSCHEKTPPNPYVRIAKIEVDAAQLEKYKAALKKQAKAAVEKEAGVLTLYAVYDKEQPAHVTVFEIYANVESYQSHIQTDHFLEYKNTVKDMVRSLVLTDVVPIALETRHRR